jgi:tRNA(Ile)-lysidine synthase
MLQRLQEFVERENLFNPKEKILLAVSGGIDSMVMLHLFHEAGYYFDVAHCNFKLRGEESDQDAYFVQQQAVRYGCVYHERSFDTSKHARDNSISIQMAARDLRYQWFDEILAEHDYTAYATAHHKDDLVETFLINLARGTGIRGLTGMKPKMNNRIRPLLFADRREIEDYKNQNHVLFREDSSNQDLKYVRNSIRHKILPLFHNLNPSFSENLTQSMDHLKSVEEIYHDYIEKAREKCMEQYDDGRFRISLAELTSLDHPEACLFAFLQPYQFNPSVIHDIYQSLKGSSGKVFLSPGHRCLLDRKHLLLEPKIDINDAVYQFYIEESTRVIDEPLTLEIRKRDRRRLKISQTPLVAHIDYDMVQFPLVVRRWKDGDYFYPLGMEGKKKISDFLIDLKIPVFDKERIWLLCSEDKVVWVIGLRLDDRFKIGPNTGTVLRIEVKY